MLAEASAQLAEMLLVCFMLAAACAMVLAVSAGERWSRRIVLTGLFAGCAAWTKNEGELFALCLGLGLSLTTWRDSGSRAALRAGRSYLVGLAPLVATLWVVKSAGVPSSEFFTQGLGSTLHNIVDIERHRVILAATLKFVTERHNLPLLFCLAVLALSAGLTRRRECRAAAAALAVTLVLMAAGFYAIYVITPSPLEWHLATSLDRLFMQLWPMFILLFFLAVRTPAEARADLASPSPSS
jgi:hypothetical protein